MTIKNIKKGCSLKEKLKSSVVYLTLGAFTLTSVFPTGAIARDRESTRDSVIIDMGEDRLPLPGKHLMGSSSDVRININDLERTLLLKKQQPTVKSLDVVIDMPEVTTTRSPSVQSQGTVEERQDTTSHSTIIQISDEVETPENKIKRIQGLVEKDPASILKIIVEQQVDYKTAEELLYKHAPSVHQKLSEAGLITTGRHHRSMISKVFKLSGEILFDIFAIEYLRTTPLANKFTSWITNSMFAGVDTLGEFLKSWVSSPAQSVYNAATGFIVDRFSTLAKVELLQRVPVASMAVGAANHVARKTAQVFRSSLGWVGNKLFSGNAKVQSYDESNQSRFEKFMTKLSTQSPMTWSEARETLSENHRSAYRIFDDADLLNFERSLPGKVARLAWKATKFAAWLGFDLSVSFVVVPVAGVWLKPVISHWLHGAIGMPASEYVSDLYYKWASKGTSFWTNIKESVSENAYVGQGTYVAQAFSYLHDNLSEVGSNVWTHARSGIRYLEESISQESYLSKGLSALKSGFRTVSSWLFSAPDVSTLEGMNNHLRVVQERVRGFTQAVDVIHNIQPTISNNEDIEKVAEVVDTLKNGLRDLSATWSSFWGGATATVTQETAEETAKRLAEQSARALTSARSALSDAAVTLKRETGLYLRARTAEIANMVTEGVYEPAYYALRDFVSSVTNIVSRTWNRWVNKASDTPTEEISVSVVQVEQPMMVKKLESSRLTLPMPQVIIPIEEMLSSRNMAAAAA
jgi:hypothetical protein